MDYHTHIETITEDKKMINLNTLNESQLMDIFDLMQGIRLEFIPTDVYANMFISWIESQGMNLIEVQSRGN
jgi:hypothetical protein